MLESNRSLLHRTAAAISWWTSSGAPADPVSLPQTLETLVESAVVGGYSAGMAIGFCLPIKTPATACFGKANLETGTEVVDETLFRIGACTRQFTAAAILLLAERSKVRLDDRIAAYFPEVIEAEDVTVRHLLAGDENSYALLGRLIERVTGEAYADFVSEALLVPAGMVASRFEDPVGIIPHRASGYGLADDRMHDFRNAPRGLAMRAADDLYATAGDLMLWNRALYSGRLLARETVELMTSGSATDSVCPVLRPLLSRTGRGFGVEVGRLLGRPAVWQWGQAPGYDAWLFHFPDDRVDLALLANTEGGATTVLEPILRAVLRV